MLRIALAFALTLALSLPFGCGKSRAVELIEDVVDLAVLAGDAPIDDLSSFTLTVTSVTLSDDAGASTPNLLASPRTFNFLALIDSEALLALTTIPSGTYESVTVTVDPASVRGVDEMGNPVTVAILSTQNTATIDDAAGGLTVFGGDFVSLSIDIDLEDSLIGEVATGLSFDLDVDADVNDDATANELDEFAGRVEAVDLANSSFDLVLLDDGAPVDGFGKVTVLVEDADFLGDRNEDVFTTAQAFLSALVPGTTVVEVEGHLQNDGCIDAQEVELEELQTEVEIEGRILSIDAVAETMTVLWTEIEEGASIATSVFSALGKPNPITIAYSDQTPITSEHSKVALTPAALVPGLEVELRFDSFAAPMPFVVSGIDIENDAVEYEGFISDVTNLPNSFELTLSENDEGVIGGGIHGPVTVDVSNVQGFTVFLDAGNDPVIDLMAIQVGMQASIRGGLLGTGNSATLTPQSIAIEPIEIAGSITSLNRETGQLTVLIDETEGFGAANLPNPILVTMDAAAVIEFDEDAGDLADLMARISSAKAGGIGVEFQGMVENGTGFRAVELEAEDDEE